ncbi:hypothetical protein [Mesobacillus foraminis]|uniref:hypothetical protein n=1 Tax=Mesobacillus foraminis TaxID=279826 RepID=UPI000EF551E1|nr:hypothetical protein [Mesobacillus foraminis]
MEVAIESAEAEANKLRHAFITIILRKDDVLMVTTIINNEWRIFGTKEEAKKAVAKEVRGIKGEQIICR